jgi:uncharacterized protein YggE
MFYREAPMEGLREESYKLKLEGAGAVKTTPDIASVFLGIISEDMVLAKAQQDNAARSKKVIDSIMALGVSEKDIKTENYSIDPQYDYVEGKQVFRGYRVTNNLRITTRNIEGIGRIIDTAVNNGANVVYNVNFSLENYEGYYKRALSLAVLNAVDKAKSLEKTLAISVDKIPTEITEEPADRIEPRELYTLKAPAASTVIKSGEIEVAAKVRAVFNYNKL